MGITCKLSSRATLRESDSSLLEDSDRQRAETSDIPSGVNIKPCCCIDVANVAVAPASAWMVVVVVMRPAVSDTAAK